MDTSTQYQSMAQVIFKAMNSRDFSTFEKILNDNAAFDFPGAGRIEGKRRVILFLTALLRKYPKLTFHVSEVVIDKEKACVVWTNEGENSKGESYSNSGMTLVHFSDDKIEFISDYFKDTSFTQQS